MRVRWLVLATAVVAVLAWGLGAWLAVGGAEAPPTEPAIREALPAGAPARLTATVVADPNADVTGADLAVSPDGRSLDVVDGEGRFATADVSSGEAVLGVHLFGTTLATPATGSSRLAANPDGRSVSVTDGPGRRLRVVDPRTGATVASAPVADLPTGVAVVGDRIHVADASGAITTLDAASLRPLGVVRVAAEPLSSLLATPDGRRLVALGAGTGIVRVLDAATGAVTASGRVAGLQGVTATSVAVDDDHAAIVTGTPDPNRFAAPDVAMVDLATGSVGATVPAPGVRAVALSHGRLVLARVVEAPRPGGVSLAQIVESRDADDPDTLIGDLVEPRSSYASLLLRAAPDGRRLYLVADGGVDAVEVR